MTLLTCSAIWKTGSISIENVSTLFLSDDFEHKNSTKVRVGPSQNTTALKDILATESGKGFHFDFT
jgi:hypothetical protein